MNIESCFNEPIYNPFTVNEYVELLYTLTDVVSLDRFNYEDIAFMFPF